MNAILSLSHFCELHGPMIVFNTQAFRDPPSLDSLHSNVEEYSKELENSQHSWKYGRTNQTVKSQTSFSTETCSACRSFPHNQAGIVSNDDENHVTFVSSQYPFQEEIFILLRQAGIRSLSCEVYPECEEAIYFGDNTRGHIISYPFLLKDFQARGFFRRYSVLVMMADKMFLLNSWTFFIKYIQEIIKYLKDSAAKIYEMEEKCENHQKGLKPPVAADNSKRHRAVANPRPLKDLIGDENVWATLHLHFTWILKGGGLRLQEKLVEGPPLLVPAVEQHSISLYKLVQMVGSKNFQKLLHHIYIGNQVVFESSDAKLLADIPLVLKPVMPAYLFRPRHVAAVHELIEDVDSVNIVTILSPASSDLSESSFSLKFLPLSVNEIPGKSSLYEVEINEPLPLNSRTPQIVAKILSLIENRKFSDSVLNLYFATLIDEWTNKVKIWSYVSQSKDLICPSLPSSTHLSPVSSTSYEKSFLSRSPSPTLNLTSGASQAVMKTSTLLTVVGALECDIPMLTALSSFYEKFGSDFPTEPIT